MGWSRAAALLLAINCLLTCGCPDKPTAATKPASPSFNGLEVELVVPADFNLPALWEVALQEWMTQTGATVHWTEYSSKTDSISKKLAEPPTSGGRIVLFPLQQLSELDARLAPVPAGGIELNDLLKGLRDRIVSRNRFTVAIPVAAPVYLCYYRADLLRKEGLKPPETWEDYQALVDSLEKWAPGSQAVEPLSPEHRATFLFARSLAYVKHPENYSVWFDLDSGQPTVETPGFQAAFEAASSAWKKMPKEITELTPVQCRNQVLEGKAALAIGMESPVSVKDIRRADSIEIGICRLPGTRRVYNTNSKRWDPIGGSGVHAPAILGPQGWAISVATTESGPATEAAVHLLTSLVGDQFDSNWSLLPKTPCRESQITTAASWHDSGLSLEEASKAVDATAQMLRDSQVVADLPIPDPAPFRDAANAAVSRLLDNEVDVSAVVHQLQTDFAKIAADRGPQSLRTDYRRGLGLPSLGTSDATR